MASNNGLSYDHFQLSDPFKGLVEVSTPAWGYPDGALDLVPGNDIEPTPAATVNIRRTYLMGRSLVIVESPAKAKTINKYLGRDYIVKSSYGHIRDLPSGGGDSAGSEDKAAKAKAAAKTKAAAKSMTETQKVVAKAARAKQALVRRMGVDPEHGWEARYEVLPGKEKVLKELQQYAKDADTIYLATDRDREGEAIAWHLREVIGGDDDRFKRVTFSEITKSAIQAAFEHSGDLDMDGVNAQQARRFLDRVVGFMVSPLLWQKVARGLSAGRVQSVAVRLITEREAEIRKFVPDEYFERIKEPMDLATIKERNMQGYYDLFSQFQRDLLLVADNAMEYNQVEPHSSIASHFAHKVNRELMAIAEALKRKSSVGKL